MTDAQAGGSPSGDRMTAAEKRATEVERRAVSRESNRIKAKVYESSAGWCVQWRSDRMPAPSWWYYASEQEARTVAAHLQGRLAP